MLGAIIKQIAVGVGVHVMTQKALPKATDWAKGKIEELKSEKEELERQEEQQEPELKVYAANWEE